MSFEERIDMKHATVTRTEIGQTHHPVEVAYLLRERLTDAGFRLKPLPAVLETSDEVQTAILNPWKTFETLDGTIHFYQGPEGGQDL